MYSLWCFRSSMRNIDLGFFLLSHLGFLIFIEWQCWVLPVLGLSVGKSSSEGRCHWREPVSSIPRSPDPVERRGVGSSGRVEGSLSNESLPRHSASSHSRLHRNRQPLVHAGGRYGECLMSSCDLCPQHLGGAWWLIGRFDTFCSKGRGFESCSSCHVGTLGKSFTRNLFWRFGVKLWHSICAVLERLWVVVDLKRCYRNSLNEWINEYLRGLPFIMSTRRGGD